LTGRTYFLSKRLSSLWTKNIKDTSKKAEVESTIRSSKTVLEQLNKIITDITLDLSKKETNFDEPNWPYKEAYLLGQRQAYLNIKRLIDI